MTSLDSILKEKKEKKGKASTLAIKVCIVKAMFFPVVMYGRESWTVMMAEG